MPPKRGRGAKRGNTAKRSRGRGRGAAPAKDTDIEEEKEDKNENEEIELLSTPASEEALLKKEDNVGEEKLEASVSSDKDDGKSNKEETSVVPIPTRKSRRRCVGTIENPDTETEDAVLETEKESTSGSLKEDCEGLNVRVEQDKVDDKKDEVKVIENCVNVNVLLPESVSAETECKLDIKEEEKTDGRENEEDIKSEVMKEVKPPIQDAGCVIAVEESSTLDAGEPPKGEEVDETKEEEEDDRFETISIDDSSSIFGGNNDRDITDKDECEKDGAEQSEVIEAKEAEIVDEMCEVISQDALDDVEDISDDDEVQYIDEEIVDDQPVDQIITSDPASRNVADAAENKFEAISDGSIDKMEQDEVIKEIEDEVEEKTVSDAEQGNIQDDTLRNEPETLEEVFFATENDNADNDDVILVEDKDNDDISDASLVDDQMSLEEISDDDLDTSKVKKRRKSGLQTPEKKSAEAETEKDNVDKDAPTELKKDDEVKEENAKKRPLSDKADSSEKENVKKRKVEEKDDDVTKPNTEKLTGGDDNEPAFYTGVICTTKNKPKVTPLDLPATQSSKHPKKQKTISPLEKQKPLPGDKAYSSSSSSRRRPSRPQYAESGCQTERTNMKGKIVQCSISTRPSQAALSGKPVKHQDVGTDSKTTTSGLYLQYQALIPSSISGEMFSAITTASLPVQDFSYSLSLGPVTMADMDNQTFRDTVLRGVKRFSLIFDGHDQGIMTGCLSRQQDVVRLIRELKRLPLGNRYMVMSVTFLHGEKYTPQWWSGTLVLMYEQDLLQAKQLVNWDGKVRCQLNLSGIPQNVSKDFVSIFFPESLSITSKLASLFSGRSMTLSFSNKILLDEIISCYDLLLINGTQISLSSKDTTDLVVPSKQEGFEEEAGVVIVHDVAEVVDVEDPSSVWGGPAVTMEEHVVVEDGDEKAETKIPGLDSLDAEEENVTKDGAEKVGETKQVQDECTSVVLEGEQKEKDAETVCPREGAEQDANSKVADSEGDTTSPVKEDKHAEDLCVTDMEESATPAVTVCTDTSAQKAGDVQEVKTMEGETDAKMDEDKSSQQSDSITVAAGESADTDGGSHVDDKAKSVEPLSSTVPDSNDTVEEADKEKDATLVVSSEEESGADLVVPAGNETDKSSVVSDTVVISESEPATSQDEAAVAVHHDEIAASQDQTEPPAPPPQVTEALDAAVEVSEKNEATICVEEDDVVYVDEEAKDAAAADVSKESAGKGNNLEDVSDEEMVASQTVAAGQGSEVGATGAAQTEAVSDAEDVVILKEQAWSEVVASVDLTTDEGGNTGKAGKDVGDQEKEKAASVPGGTVTDCNKWLMSDGVLVEMEVEDVSEGEGKEEKVMQASATPWSSDSRPHHDDGQSRSTTSPGHRNVSNQKKISTMVRDREHREPRDRDRPLVLKSSRDRLQPLVKRNDTSKDATSYSSEYDAYSYTTSKPPPPRYDVPPPRLDIPPPNWNRGYNSWRSNQPPPTAWRGPDLTAPPPGHWAHHKPDHHRGGDYPHYSPHHPPPRIDTRRDSRSSRAADHHYRERSYGGYSKSYRGDRGHRRSRSRTLSSLSSESDHRASRRRRPASSRHNVDHSPISVSSRSRSLSSISRSPSPAAYSSRGKRRRSRSPRRMSSRRVKSRGSKDRSPGTPPRRTVKADHAPPARRSQSPENYRRSSDHRSRDSAYKRRRSSRDHQLPDRNIQVTTYRRSQSPGSPPPKRKIFQARSPKRRSPSPLQPQWRHSAHSSRHDEGEGRSAAGSSTAHSYKGGAGQSIQYTVPPPSSTPQYAVPVPPTGTWQQQGYQPQPVMGASYTAGSAMYNPSQQYYYPSGNPQLGVQQQAYQTQQASYQPAVKTLTGSNKTQPHRATQNIQVPLTSQTGASHHSHAQAGKSAAAQSQPGSVSSVPPSSRSQASNAKKSWSMGSNALMFQRILSSDGKGKP